MKPLFLPLLLAIPALAADAPAPKMQLAAPMTTVKTATVTPFITGLKEPQGLALDADRNLIVCDYGAGEILKFSLDGKPLGKLATDLRGPSAIVSADGGKTLFVTERKANRVLRFGEGKRQNEMEDVPEPTGLIWDFDPKRGDGPNEPRKLWAASHTTSKIYRKEFLNGYVERRLIYAPVVDAETNFEGGRPGFTGMVSDNGAILVSDQAGQRVAMISDGGRIATFASGIEKPAGLAKSPAYPGAIYLASEGSGGQLLRLDAEGGKVVVAEKLGRPSGVLFLDAKTILVSNWDGNIWKVALP